jgi:micrococcal nuclease
MLRTLIAALIPAGLASLPSQAAAPAVRDNTLTSCTVTDGDTIRCGAERIRLLGIDAPELAGHCRRRRDCAPGDGQTSKRSLAAAVFGPITVDRVGRDRNGRTLAIVHAGGVNLSCQQLERRQAIYKPRWDNGKRVASECPALANLYPSH